MPKAAVEPYESPGLGVREPWIQIQLLTKCPLSKPQCPHLQVGMMVPPSSTGCCEN